MILESNHRQKLAEHLSALIIAAQSATHAADDAAAQRLGINRTDMRCLGVLIEQGSLSASSLAEAVGLSRGAMTIALDRLERAEFIRRKHGSHDRRSILIETTGAAREAIAQLWQPIAAEGQEILQEYSDEELELLCRFFEDYIRLQQRHAQRVRVTPPR